MIPAILSGGSGTRLWPVSRKTFPKQFCELFEESLIQKTLIRLQTLGSPWIITTRDSQILTERLYRQFNMPVDQIVYEPLAKNTAAAIALFCKVLNDRGLGNEVVAIFPADHFIENAALFGQALKLAEAEAEKGFVVTLGIRPTFPSTGYGYIELSHSPSKLEAIAALGFREKPDLATAESYLASKKYFWNAGIFIFPVHRMISLLETHLSELWSELSKLKQDHTNLNEVYSSLPSISIDYGIMEKLSDLKCIPCPELGWSDVGSWDEVSRLSTESGPIDSTYSVKGANNSVFSHIPDKVYALSHVNDLIVVDTADALLVVKKGESQSVKDLQQMVEKADKPQATDHPFEYRPWGKFEILRDTNGFKSKVILVEPGQQLSYQSHAKRAEHWIVIRGTPEVVLNDEVLRPGPGEHVFIPIGAKHRMRNPGKEVVEVVEVQTGTYFGEDDIVRYEDDYSRT